MTVPTPLFLRDVSRSKQAPASGCSCPDDGDCCQLTGQCSAMGYHGDLGSTVVHIFDQVCTGEAGVYALKIALIFLATNM